MVSSTLLSALLAAAAVTASPLVSRTELEPASPVEQLAARSLTPTAVIGFEDFDPKPSSLPYMMPPTGPAPPIDFAGGVLTCKAASITQDLPAFYMTRNEAAAAVARFCNGIQPGVVFKQSGGTPFQITRNEGPYTYISKLSATWTPGSNTSCPTLDFSDPSASGVCQTSLLTNIVDACNPDENGLQFWKAGGTFVTDCITWNIERYFLPPVSN